jgi:hypothetical protein
MPSIDDLLQALGDRVITAAALRSALSISPPTLSRVVADAGEAVLRIGRARATRYARTRELAGLGRVLPLFRIDARGATTPAGRLHVLQGRGTAWEQDTATIVHAGLPPAVVDMAPQGYLGRAFAARHSAELGLPRRLQDWTSDHELVALARRGEDCVGDLIVGDESLQRWHGAPDVEVTPGDYPALARRSAEGDPGSSAGGERPKFGASSSGRRVLVKFATGGATAAARRWRDLLWCEWKALDLLSAAGVPAAPARIVDLGGERFLEVERFDRVGHRGRRPVLSLLAVLNEYVGHADTWTTAAARLGAAPLRLPEKDARRLVGLDVFGQLIGNTDRHFGNVTFFAEPGKPLRLAPAYDMLPMILAPSLETGELVERTFKPAGPDGRTLPVWRDAAGWALRYWRALAESDELSREVRVFARDAAAQVETLKALVAPREP